MRAKDPKYKGHTYFIACVDRSCAADKMGKLSGAEIDIIEKSYPQLAESSGHRYAGQMVLRVFVGPFEQKMSGSREDRAFRQKHTLAFPVRIR
jgi:hypothetical protein